MPVFGVILVRIFPYLDRIRRYTPYLSLFSPNAGKYWPEKLRIRTPFTHLDFVNNFYQYFCKRDISKNETVLKSEFLNTLYNQIFDTAQNLEFSIKNFISKCDQICRKLRVWSHLLKKSLMENFTFRAVSGSFCLGGRIRANSVHTRIKHKSSRHLEVYYKKVFYKDFSKITGKHLCRSFFFNKSSGLTSVTLLEKRLWQRCFPVSFAAFL